ncbi:hypothetical protein [Exiguobacterium sp. AM39-5BH]|uniref:hypothetical protein n=1 Tax=Exiguobacterium sp. AM39-5BH TaxID=2292355 RepID=UPI001F25910A|nr:hypothetical protein [Exiguobacterium sp. AM39-5BH]
MKLDFPNVGETLHHTVLKNGLRVYLLKKTGYEKTYATFTTKYGSIDRRFKLEDWVDVPDGIAHFLEHKMFEKEDGDVFQQFGRSAPQRTRSRRSLGRHTCSVRHRTSART